MFLYINMFLLLYIWKQTCIFLNFFLDLHFNSIICKSTMMTYYFNNSCLKIFSLLKIFHGVEYLKSLTKEKE